MAYIFFHREPPFGSGEEMATQLIQLAGQRRMQITHAQLQCLLYYAQGYSLAFLQTLLFDEPIEIEANAPVVRSVEARFSCYGEDPIPWTKDLRSEHETLQPGGVFDTVLDRFGHLPDNDLQSTPHWRASCQDGRIADPRLVAKWWCDEFEQRLRATEPSTDYAAVKDLKQHPEIAARVGERTQTAQLISWR